MGEEEGKEARLQTRASQNKRAISGGSNEGPDRPSPENGRKIRGDSQGSCGETWKELRKHQRLVPHDREGDKGNQEGWTGQICLGVLIGSVHPAGRPTGVSFYSAIQPGLPYAGCSIAAVSRTSRIEPGLARVGSLAETIDPLCATQSEMDPEFRTVT